MSLAERISIINRGFFSDDFPADAMLRIPSTGNQAIVNWSYVRPALLELDAMPWCELPGEWQYFLDQNRYPIGNPMELSRERANSFRSLTIQLRQKISEPMRILTSVQPTIPEDNVTVTIASKDIETIEMAIGHVRSVTHLAAIDDAISVDSLQTGSLDIVLTAGKVTLMGLKLAIILATRWKDPRSKADARRILQVMKRRHADDNLSEEEALDLVNSEVTDEFWKHFLPALKTAFENAGKGTPESNEAKGKIEYAAKEIHDNADAVFAQWKLPPASIHGLPGGAIIHLNFDNPEAIGRVVRAIAAPPDQR